MNIPAGQGEAIVIAFVSWPSTFMGDLVTKSLSALGDSRLQCISDEAVVEALVNEKRPKNCGIILIQWSTYDEIIHELTQKHPTEPDALVQVISSSFTIRKAVIRKHYLHNTVVSYIAKHPDSPLKEAVPKTWTIDIAFADELDELWADELYDLGELLEYSEKSQKAWFILKPSMSDRGMGIRLFRTKDDLMQILYTFDDDSEEEEEEQTQEPEDDSTGVAISRLRYFVIQEYLFDPLLVDPSEARLSETLDRPGSHGTAKKFHLRAYCVASGALNLYLCTNILALFAAAPYAPPCYKDGNQGGDVDLQAHLTNTSLQHDNPDTQSGVRLLSELVGCTVYSEPSGRSLSQTDIDGIVQQVSTILAETFKAAIASPVHFQALPNAFELFGADLLVTHKSPGTFQVSLLELNAEPAIELTGDRLGWILDKLFQDIAEVCVAPRLGFKTNEDDRPSFKKCLAVEVRANSSW